MTIIGTDEEIKEIKHQCDGRCADGEWCIFGFQKDVCPVDDEGGCLAFASGISKDGTTFSVLNER